MGKQKQINETEKWQAEKKLAAAKAKGMSIILQVVPNDQGGWMAAYEQPMNIEFES